MEAHPQDLRSSKHDHVMFVGQGALPLVGDGCVEIFELDIVGKVQAFGKGSGLHVAITALRHVAEGHQ